MSASGNPLPAQVTLPPDFSNEQLFVRLAREIAMDIQSLDVILKSLGITNERWDEIRVNQRFNALLSQFMAEWEGALNTVERTRLKAQSCVEEALPEMFAKIHDLRENLPAKVEAFKAVAKVAGMQQNGPAVAEGSGSKFSVTINLGGEKQLINISLPNPPPVDAEDH